MMRVIFTLPTYLYEKFQVTPRRFYGRLAFGDWRLENWNMMSFA